MRRFNSAIVRVKNSDGDFEPLPALRGYSSYQLAVANGFEGTEEEWMESIIGDGWVGAYQRVDTRVTELENENNFKFIGFNPVTVDTDTPNMWISLGFGCAFINKRDVVIDQPHTYGYLISYNTGNSANLDAISQMWISTAENGQTYHRSGNTRVGWFSSWIMDYNTYNLKPVTLDANGKVNANQACSSRLDVTASRALTADDAGKFLLINPSSATGINITIPDDSNGTIFPTGTEIEICRFTTAPVTITAGANTYLQGTSLADSGGNGYSATINSRYGVVSLKKVTVVTWLIVGDVS